MPDFSSSTLRLFQRFFTSTSPHSQHAGIKTVLDGNTAVAATEACIAEAAGLGATFPADAAAYAWQAEQQRRGKNCFGKTLTGRDTEGARGALAAAIGLSLSGARATTFLSSPDVMSAQDWLVTAVGRLVPLVVHLTNRTLAAHAGALGSGHKAYHVSADSGFFILHASTVQEAVDFSLIARRVAELTLIPGLVAMDGEQIALAAQEVELPHPEWVRQFLGDPDDEITSPTAAQKMLFGETRRRVPRWHNLDRPVMHGALQGPESWTLGAVAKHPYFHHHLNAILEESFALLSKHTGRTLGPVSSYQTDNAQIVLVAQGSAIETLQAVADYMRQVRKIKVGVLGIHGFRPFPGALIAEHLKKKRIVAVLERTDTPLAADPPLMRQVRAALERALENGRLGSAIHPGYPLIKEKQLPRFRSVVYGLGGQPLRAADLITLCDTLEEKGQGRIFLGFEFARASSIYPKRQVLLDNLRRSYPDIAQLGLRSQQPAPDLRPAGAITVAIHNLSEQSGKGLSVEAAVLLYRLLGGWIRSRPGIFQERWISGWLDIFTYSPQSLRDPGDDLPIDLAVLTAPHRLQKSKLELRQDGILLAVSSQNDAALWQSLAPEVRNDIQRKQIRLYGISNAETADTSAAFSVMLGSLLGTLLDSGLLDIKVRRVLNSYEDSLHHLAERERTARLNAFKMGLETVRQIDYQTLAVHASNTPVPWHDEAPMAVRHLGQSGPTYDSLPRFWDQVGVLYRNGDIAELIPDPYLATGVIPPLSSTFRDLSIARNSLPAFDPSTCTGCGQCWTRCPDSAIGSVVLSPTALIDAGIKLTGGETLRMAASKLATRLHSLGRDTDINYNTVGEFIQDAFAGLKDKLPLNEERKQALTEAVAAVNQKIGDLPVARTEAFFYERERYQRETGELLSLVINPDACKACGLCISACEPGSLTAAPQTQERVQKAHQLWRIWEHLPDTSGKTIEQASTHSEVGAMPAILLSRHCQFAIAGGDNAEAGSGEKIALRLALAVTEFQRQPLNNRFIQEITEVREKLMASIHNHLVDALPTDDLDALAKGLEAIRPEQSPLSALTEQKENAVEQIQIDAIALRRQVKITQALDELHWRLSKGEQGLGRARLSLAIAPGTLTNWAGTWPDNPFQVPVAVDFNSDTAQLASGLLEGQLREAAKGLGLLRQAKLELEKPEEAARSTLESLHWRDLTREEQERCPPLLLIGNDDVLSGKGFSAITRLLGTDLPIKIMVLTDLDLELGTANVAGSPMAIAREAKTEPSLLALAQRHAYIVQTSIANTSHFLKSLEEALEFAGPALIHVHAPSPEQHGFAPDQTLTQANRAINSRVFPLFRYHPKGEGVFGSRISLSGNPAPEESVYQEAESILTPADWAIHEQRFAPYFTPLNATDTSPIPIADYLKLEAAARQRKTPFVSVVQTLSSSEEEKAGEKAESDETVRLKVEPAMIAACEERIQAWRTLQELAGLVTPFTKAVEAKLKQEINEAHQAELATQKQEYEARIENLRAEMEAEIAARVKGQLMALAGYSLPN
ncbi:MAG: pyruvate ferredoxin oxidoreductase [Candidatus Parabeggiatoa sp. nov. 3]|nr:MAG: pyruvate ferredoxin oxidoreductase [Gammaproteobacteria bacterium]RKZ81135.1 MAG: pyruvate ferredoxin oxidoreductase [Gammaproteobacteria bacterium]HEW97179.1 pyruvate ferredoxin oxidoreductase [Beggiatoa sp.]